MVWVTLNPIVQILAYVYGMRVRPSIMSSGHSLFASSKLAYIWATGSFKISLDDL